MVQYEFIPCYPILVWLFILDFLPNQVNYEIKFKLKCCIKSVVEGRTEVFLYKKYNIKSIIFFYFTKSIFVIIQFIL